MKNTLFMCMLIFSLSNFTTNINSKGIISEDCKNELSKKQRPKELLKSRFGKWILKKVYVSARKKQLRRQLKGFQGTKAEKRAFKKAQKQIIKDEKAQEFMLDILFEILAAIIGIIFALIPFPLNIFIVLALFVLIVVLYFRL